MTKEEDETTEVRAPRKSLFDPQQHFYRHLRRGFAALNQAVKEDEADAENGIDDDDHNKERTEEDATSVTASESDDDTAKEDTMKDTEWSAELLSHVPINVIDEASSSNSIMNEQSSLEIFSKIQTVLCNEYHSTLRNVPYQHFRSGAKGTIKKLPVRLELTPLVTLAPATTTADPSDATEWHTHYCAHMYICACDSVEQYRTKVKPAIQAFVSQLESLTQERMKKSTAAYLILFCPVSLPAATTSTNQSSAATSASEDAPRSRVASFASRVAAARQRMSAAASSTSTVEAASEAEEAMDSSGGGGGSGSGVSSGLTKIDREILRRLTADFPQGRICSLPNIARPAENSTATKTTSSIEWETLWIELGATLVDAFAERCRQYDEQLKKLATKCATRNLIPSIAATADKELLLAKESFAFLYQLYRQPAEALLQYEELRALLPDEKDKKTATDDLLEQALASPADFRECIRRSDDLGTIAYELEHYLLVRETSQLFGMENAAGVVERCKTFVSMLFQIRQPRAAVSIVGIRDLNTWAFEFCWDVQRAISQELNMTAPEPSLARAMCDLLSFARLCLLKLAKALLPDYSGTNLGDSALPPELKSEWEPWAEPKDPTVSGGDAVPELPLDNLVATSFANIRGFEMLYMEVTKVLATNHESCNRSRHAACLRHEIIEIAARRNNLRSAARELGEIARVYEADGWDLCNFFLLFRLAKLQRQFETGHKYVQTLVRCFSSLCAPPKALETLFHDLQAVIQFMSPSGYSMAAAPIFRPMLSLEKFQMMKVAGNDRNLLKKVYSIGETVSIKFNIVSNLPKDINLKELAVSLVPFKTYVAAMEDSLELKKWDVFKMLTLENLVLQPGANEYTHEWVPQVSGQFILSSVSVNWDNCVFTYSAKEMKRPTIRIDIIPCEHAQSIEIKPDYIVPGHKQAMEIVFSSTLDSVEKGAIQLVGSPGLVVCGAEEAAGDSPTWQSLLEMELPKKCAPGESIAFPIVVKSTMDKDVGAVATLHAHASTLFRRENDPSKAGTTKEGASLECSLEKKISTLGKRAFSLGSPEVVAYTADKLLINAALRCNAPRSFLLQKWSIDLPDFLKLADDGDLNDSLANTDIASGERLQFTFDCAVQGQVPLKSEGTLTLVFDNREGTTFTDSYSLRLKRPEMQPLPKAVTEKVSINVSTSASEGTVGHPIDITVSIDMTRVQTKTIHYAVSTRVCDWVLNGKTEGVIKTQDSATHTLVFVALPMRPGAIDEYLKVSLTIEDENARKLELPVKLNQYQPFISIDPPNHPTVAFPIPATVVSP